MSPSIKNCWKYVRVLENLKGSLSKVYVEVMSSFRLDEWLEKAIYIEMTYILKVYQMVCYQLSYQNQ